ncbi:hypothetical protein K501DRAFT_319875 [Backusella circina FSU 941]|nr:hypothetical protein K501DRAFT_319875 [Backusella circina FSU 941]
MTNTFLIRNESSSSLDQVDLWQDSGYEEEDYLPQREYHKPILFHNNEQQQGREIFNRMNQPVWDIIHNLNNDTPPDQVRRIIDFTIDNGMNVVNLSKLDLKEIPNEISELKYLTAIHNGVIKSTCLQLYLYSNVLQNINPALFELKNLTVLSLRDNNLKAIPPEIIVLENLVELSIGNNQLEVLPAEILRLKKLNNLALNPNPLLIAEKRDQRDVSIASLVEISIRYILATHKNKLLDYAAFVPSNIVRKMLSSDSQNNSCESCHQPFFNPSVKVIHWRDYLGNTQVPFLYRFCSTFCCDKMF